MTRKGWKIPGVFKADAEKVDSEIKKIGEEIKPADLVDYAKENPDSELHKCFEWDDTIAAEKYRLFQARKVLTQIVEIPEREDEPSYRGYYEVETISGTTAYKETNVIFKNIDERKNLLHRAIKELHAFKQKYKMLEELEDVFAAIDEL